MYCKKAFESNPSCQGLSMLRRDICFSAETGVPLYCQLLLPWTASAQPVPLVIFIQGSGFRFPNVEYELPQMAAMSRRGLAVATVTHRSCEDGYPAPAFLADVKTAVRFFRKNAGEFGILPDKIGVFGSSSGGCTALLLDLTPDDPAFETGEHAGFSDRVSAVVDCFGPTDLKELYDALSGTGTGPNWQALIGGDLSLLETVSPICHVKPGRAYPPFMLLHGDADTLVPISHSLKMAEKLDAAGADTTFCTVHGAPHEGPFWSQPVLDEITGFFLRHLKA